MTLNITTKVRDSRHNDTQDINSQRYMSFIYAYCRAFIVMLTASILSVLMLSASILSVLMLSAVQYAECSHAECQYAKCYAECRGGPK